MSAIRVCVIGAGAAGLVALRHLVHRAPQFEAVAYEQASQIGGTWVYSEKTEEDLGVPIHSSMYKNLRTNLPKEVMAFPDFPFAKNLPSFMHHTDVLKYLDDYANHFNVKKYIKFNTSVLDVTPTLCNKTEKRKWIVEVESEQEGRTTQEFDAVIVCTGHFSCPAVPDIPGLDTYKGRYLHSHSYRHPEDFKDQVVILLGASSSGTDIALDLAPYAKKIYLSHKKAKHPSTFPSNVEQISGIHSVSGENILLEDDRQVTADTLVFCTGYLYKYPFLEKNKLIQVSKEQRVTPLYHHLIHAEHPTLSFIGIPKIICPFPLYDRQVHFILATLDGSHKLPSKEDMKASIELDYTKRLESGMPTRYSHHMGDKQWEYNDLLAKEVGFDPLKPVVGNLYGYVATERRNKLAEYKQYNFEFADDTSFRVL